MVALAGVTRDGFRWRLAPCLVVLVRELKDHHPDRSTASDGSIASAAHSRANPSSDHEADRTDGLVKALDLTDDPPRFDPDDFADQLIARRDSRIKYVIKDGRIWRSYKHHAGHPAPWTPEPYTGPNAHRSHAHISVTDQGAHDTRTWFPHNAQEDLMDVETRQGLVILTYNACLGRNPEDLQVIAAGAESIRTHGVAAYAASVANSPEGVSWRAKLDRLRRG